MAAFNIFNEPLLESADDQFGSRTGIPGHTQLDPSGLSSKLVMDIAVEDEPARGFWHPGQHLNGIVSIDSEEPVSIASGRVRLEGICRCYISMVRSNGQKAPKLFSYKFLSQDQDVEYLPVTGILYNRSGGFRMTSNFKFIISHIVVPPSDRVAQQCLQLPPSLLTGKVLHDIWGTRYGQPLICYYVVAEAEVLACAGSPASISTNKEIRIRVRGVANPPLATEDFPAEFVERQLRLCRPNRWKAETFAMTLISSEPSAILLTEKDNFGWTLCKIDFRVQDTRPKVNMDHLKRVLCEVRLEVAPILVVKTFYATRPFPQMPGRAMIVPGGPYAIHQERLILDSFKSGPSSWHIFDDSQSYSNLESRHVGSSHEHDEGTKSSNQASSETYGPITFQSIISTPVKVPGKLHPSFCSAVASRQYSLVLICNVKGVHSKNFALEVPVQVLHTAVEGQDGAASQAQGWHFYSTSHDTDDIIPQYPR